MIISFGEMIRLRRKELKLTQYELADLLGVSKQAVSRYERNQAEPGFTTLIKMAELFSVDVNFLLDYKRRAGSAQDVIEIQTGDTDMLNYYHLCSRDHQRMLKTLAASMANLDNQNRLPESLAGLNLISESESIYEEHPERKPSEEPQNDDESI